MTPIKILAIIESRIISGPARNLIDFIPLGRSVGIEMTIATFLRRESRNLLTETLQKLSIPVISIPEDGPYDFSTIRKLKSLTLNLSPDLVQTHAVKSHFLMRLSGIPHRIPWVAFHHGYTSTAWQTRLHNKLDRWSLRDAAQLVTVSRASLKQLQAQGIDTSKSRVFHNAVPENYGFESRSKADLQALRATLKIPEGCKVILSVGRLSKEKDQLSLVQAMSELPKQVSPYLLMVGDGPERKTIAQKVQELGLVDRVILTGMEDHVEPFYGLADVVVISSRSEGSPNVLLEALAAGVPVVTTAVGGIPEMVNDGEHVYLVQPGNAKQMADAIATVLADDERSRLLVENSKNLVRARFSPEERARGLTEMYKGILEPKGKVN